MPIKSFATSSSSSRLRERLLALAVSIGATVVALIAAEWLLREYEARIADSSVITPGLLRYHPRLGWDLAPYWAGEHRHHDFQVTYRINADGFRGDFPLFGAPKTRPRIAVLGDSFTFGIGVDDDRTFVALVGAADPQRDYLNFAVPGYSTDQELLQLTERGLVFEPDEIWLAFYLGNDLIDNALAHPLQADLAKPYFVFEGDRLKLLGSPPPRGDKPAESARLTLEAIAFGDAIESRPNSRLLARVLAPVTVDNGLGVLSARLSTQVELQRALTRELVRAAGTRRLTLLLLPGQSSVLARDSAAATFAEFGGNVMRAIAGELNVAVIDTTAALRDACAHQACFHPNEGHLNEIGHRVVADSIRAERGGLDDATAPH